MKQGEKNRSYTVLMFGLAEERRVCGMDEETWQRRSREIMEDCGFIEEKKEETK